MAQIASHLGITYPKQLLKRELKALIVGKLVKLEITVLPAQLESAVLVEEGTSCEGVGSQKNEEDPHRYGDEQ